MLQIATIGDKKKQNKNTQSYVENSTRKKTMSRIKKSTILKEWYKIGDL